MRDDYLDMEFGIQDMAFEWFQIMTTSNEIEVLNDMHTKKYTPFFVFTEGFYKENKHIFLIMTKDILEWGMNE